MKAILALLLICAISVMSDHEKDWEDFKTKYGKSYTNTDDEVKGQDNFKGNLKKIEDHNARAARGEVHYTLGVNKFADVEHTQFMMTHANYKPSPLLSSANGLLTATAPIVGVGTPASVDWRTVIPSVLTPIKDQGNCGSCYAFSSVSTIESCRVIFGGKPLVALSEQQMVDCTKSLGNAGCNGGWEYLIFNYVKSKGLQTASSYIYTAKAARTCSYNAAAVVARVTGYATVPNNETLLMQAVSLQPVNVAVDATSFQFYTSGVLSCSGLLSLNHAVVLVGYGATSTGQKYWIIRNSWGTSWGMSGYVLLLRDGTDQCGVLSDILYPTGCS